MSEASGLCPGCFEEPRRDAPCPNCGFAGETEFHTVLEPGTVLEEKYEIGRVLGQPGGFGVTYLTYDLRLQRRIALKELMPRELVARDRDGATLHPHSRSDTDLFRYTLESFLNEARMVAKFSHPNLVRVLDYFEANGTAYFAMEFYEGRTLAEVVEERGTLSGPEAVEVARPLLEALEEVHAAGILHRDIKPTNIYLTAGGRPVLLDFGAARQALGERSRALTSVLTPGYAPFEQYHAEGNQGPWTDVYGVAATLYFVVAGQGPPEAGARMQAGQMVVPPAEISPGLTPAVDRAIMKGLELEPGDRPATARAFLALLEGEAPSEEAATAVWTPAGADQATVMAGAAGTAETVVTAGAPRPAAPRAEAAAAAPEDGAVEGDAEEPAGRRRVSPAWLGAATATVVLALSIPLAASFLGGPEPADTAGAEGETTAPASMPESSDRAADGGEAAEGTDPAAPPGAPGVSEEPTPATVAGGGAEETGASAAVPTARATAEPSSAPAETDAATATGGDAASEETPAEPSEPPPAAPANGVAVLLFGDAEGVRSAETEILGSTLREGSLRAVDAGTLQMMRDESGAVERALAGDLSALADIGRRQGVEFLVIGDLSTSARPTAGTFWGATAELDVKLYRVSTRSLAEARTFRAGDTSLVPGTSEADALRKATAQVGERAAAAVRRWIRSALR